MGAHVGEVWHCESIFFRRCALLSFAVVIETFVLFILFFACRRNVGQFTRLTVRLVGVLVCIHVDMSIGVMRSDCMASRLFVVMNHNLSCWTVLCNYWVSFVLLIALRSEDHTTDLPSYMSIGVMRSDCMASRLFVVMNHNLSCWTVLCNYWVSFVLLIALVVFTFVCLDRKSTR